MKKLLLILFVLAIYDHSFGQKNKWVRLDTAGRSIYLDSRSFDIGLINFDKYSYHKYFYTSNPDFNNNIDCRYSLGTMYDEPMNKLSSLNIVQTKPISVKRLNIMDTYDPLRCQYLAMLKYPNNKIIFGSYKSYIPDYEYYQIWENMLTQKYPKIMTIKDKDSVMAIAMDSFNLFYEKHYSTIGNFKYAAEFHFMGTNSPRDYTDFNFPQFINNDEVLTIKNTYINNPKLIRIDAEAKEHTIKDATGFLDIYFAYRNKKIYWSEKQIDKYGNEFGNIYCYDMVRRKSVKLTSNLPYHFPCPSEEGYSIAAVRKGKTYDYLCQLDAKSGQEEMVIDSSYKYAYPNYSWDGKDIYVVATDTNDRNAMIKFNVKNGTKSMVVDFTYHHISSIHVGRKFLYFDASFSGLNNIYCYDLQQKKVVTVTNRLSGCYHPASNESEDKLLFTEYTHVGKNLMVVNVIEFDKWRKVEKILDIPEVRLNYIGWIEQYRTSISNTTKKYKSTNKKELYYNTYKIIVQRPIGSIVYNRGSIVKSTSFVAALDFNRIERSISTVIGFSKAKNKSEISIKYGFIPRRLQPGDITFLNTHSINLEYNVHSSKFTKGYQHLQYAQIKPGMNINKTYSFPYIDMSYSYKIMKPACHSNIYSNRALNMGLVYIQDLKNFNTGIQRYHLFAEGIQKIPFNAHIISKIGFISDQKCRGMGYYYNFMLNRGNYRMKFNQAYYLNLECAFPIALLDYSYHKLLYVKAVRGSIFFDAALATQSNSTMLNNSQGIEVYAECYLNRAFKLNIGFRVARVQNMVDKSRASIVVQPIIPNYSGNL